jgi:hypothetical protein
MVAALISHRHGLVGRPDYIIETDQGVAPVELKSYSLNFAQGCRIHHSLLPARGRALGDHGNSITCRNSPVRKQVDRKCRDLS